MRFCSTCAAATALSLSTLLATAACGGTSTERVAIGFSRPVFAASPPGDTDRLFVAEQFVGTTGRIRIVDLNTGSITGTFLEIPNLAVGSGGGGSEQGLLGFAFDPDYASNGFLYVNITTAAGGGDTAIRRYKVSDGDPDVADPDSGFDVLTFNQPQGNHNGGWIGFSPIDGFLYIASGDGGGSDDNDSGHTANIGNAQDITNNLLGKMLRIDPSRDDEPTIGYTVPGDNPFVDVTGDDEIWSYGLRNPFRASFDRQTGDLWIGDVGQNNREEVDFQPADSGGGENYGWRLREGTIATPTGGVGGPPPAGNVEPIYDYGHVGGQFGGNTVIGGYVYRGPVAEFQGHYIFSDAGSQNIWKIDPEAIDVPASVTRINDQLTADVGFVGSIPSFSEDDQGNLYLLELFSGEIFRVTTDSEDIVWNGDDAVGAPGDGTSWGDANNWTRGASVDSAFVNDDHAIFVAGSSQSTINLGSDRTVAAATFQADYTLVGNELRVLSGNVTVEGGAVATIDSSLAAETANHSIRKLGSGTLLVTGDADQTVVKEGTLGGTGTLNHLTAEDGSTVAPGTSAGTLSVTNSFTMEQGSRLEIEIGGTTPGTDHDRIEIGGVANLAGGTLDVVLIDSYQPGAGDSFAFLSANGGFDNFAAANLPALDPGLVWQLNPGGITFSLNVATALPGDYNQDGTVNAADYTRWRDTLGEEVTRGSFADGSGDGTVNQADYTVWRLNFGSADQGAVAVPEPQALLTIVLVGITLIAYPVRRA